MPVVFENSATTPLARLSLPVVFDCSALVPLARLKLPLLDCSADARAPWKETSERLKFGVLTFAWDAQEVRHLRAVLAMGIDAVYCDRPERMVATVSEWIAD